MPNATFAGPCQQGENRVSLAACRFALGPSERETASERHGQGGPHVRWTALVDNVEHVCCRYRLAAFQPYLKPAGHRLDLRPLPRRWCSWLRLERRLRHADGVILQRKLLSPWALYSLRRAARILIFDFDDA